MGVSTDFDLGNPFDDYVGTNVENAYVFANNDLFDDESNEGPGYGSNAPRIACKILAGPYADANGIDDAGPFNGNQEYGDYTKGWIDGIIDNERMGLSGSSYSFFMSGPTGVPQNQTDFYNVLRNVWNNGTPVTFGGNGYDPLNEDALSAKYVFPGESDPYNMGTDGDDPNYPLPGGWTEENEDHMAGDRRINANCGPFNLNAGERQSIDYMYVFAQQSDDPETDIADLLAEYVNIAADHLDALPTGILTSVKRAEKGEIGFGLYPNPAKSEVTLSITENVVAKYCIYNILGAAIASGTLELGEITIDISNLRSGIYLVNVQAGNLWGTRKLVVE